MSFWGFTQRVQARVVKFALKRTLGPFFRQDLALEQLDVEVSSSRGVVVLRDIELNTDELNRLVQALPARVVSGRVGAVTVQVTWESLWQATLTVTVEGTHVVLEHVPERPAATAASVFESLVTSQQIADEYLRQEKSAAEPAPVPATPAPGGDDVGAILTQFINRMLSRVKVDARDTTLVLRYSDADIALHLPEVTVRDETPPPPDAATTAPVALKVIRLAGADLRFNDTDVLVHVDKSNYINLKLALLANVSPAYDIDCFLRSVDVVLAPQHLHTLVALATALTARRDGLDEGDDGDDGNDDDARAASPGSLVSVDSPAASAFHTPLARSRVSSTDAEPMLGRSLGAADFARIDLGLNREHDRANDDDDEGRHDDDDDDDDDDRSDYEPAAAPTLPTAPATVPSEPSPTTQLPTTLHLQLHLRQVGVQLLTGPASHVGLHIHSLALELTQAKHKLAVNVTVQSMTAHERLPPELLAPSVVEFFPFPVEPVVPVLAFTAALPADTTAVAPERAPELAAAMTACGLFRPSARPANAPRSAMAGAAASLQPDIVVTVEQHAARTSVAIKLQPLLLRLDLRVLDRLHDFIVPPLDPDARTQDPEDDEDGQDAHAHTRSARRTRPTAVSLHCPMLRLDLATARVVVDPTRSDFRPGLYTYPASTVVDLHDLAVLAGHNEVGLIGLDPRDLYVGFNKVLVCLRQPVAASRQYTMTAIALVDGGDHAQTSSAIVHWQDPCGASLTTAPDAAELMREHRADPSGFNATARQMAKALLTCTIWRVIAHMDRAQFEMADLIFNEATEWTPRFVGTLAERAAPARDIVFRAAGEDDDKTAHVYVRRSLRPPSANVHLLCADAVVGKIAFSITDGMTLYAIDVADLRAFRVIQLRGYNLNFLHLTVTDAGLADVTDASAPLDLINRSSSAAAAAATAAPVLDMLLTIGWDKVARIKDIAVALRVHGLVLQYLPASDWMTRLPRLLDEPPMEGLYADYLHRTIKLDVALSDIAAQYRPRLDSFHAVLAVSRGDFSSLIIVGSPTLAFNLACTGLRVWLRDYDGALVPTGTIIAADSPPWQALGYVAVLTVQDATLFIRTGLESLVQLRFGRAVIDTCADSFSCFVRAINYLVEGKDLSRPLDADAAAADAAAADTSAPAHDAVVVDQEALDAVDETTFVHRAGEIQPETPIAGAGYRGGRSAPRHGSPADGNGSSAPTSAPDSGTLPEPMQGEPDLDWDHLDDVPRPRARMDLLSGSEIRLDMEPPAEPPEDLPALRTPDESQLTFGAADAPAEVIRVIDDAPLRFDEDHFDRTHAHENNDRAKEYALPERPAFHLDITVDVLCWCLYDGLDFSTPPPARAALAAAPAASASADDDNDEPAEPAASAPPTPDDDPAAAPDADHGCDDFTNIELNDAKAYLDARTAKSADLRAHLRFQRARSAAPVLKAYAFAFAIGWRTFAPGDLVASHLTITVRDLRVRDLLRSSQFKHLLTYWLPGPNDPPRETGSVMLEFQSTAVRQSPRVPTIETRLRLRILPVRLYIDQGVFDFLLDFFTHTPPSVPGPYGVAPPSPTDGPKTFYQLVTIAPVAVKVDYMPGVLHWDSLLEGDLIELAKRFHIEGSVVRLPAVRLAGLEGFERVRDGVLAKYQLIDLVATGVGVASGVTVVGSIVNLASALLNLIATPTRGDGRVLRQGAGTVIKTLTLETIKLSTKLVVGTQMILLFANSAVASREPVEGDEAAAGESRSTESFDPSFFASPPANVREGAQQGLHSLQARLGDALYSAVTLPIEAYHQHGAAASARTALRAIPSALLKPLIGSVEAVGKVLVGIRNEVDPSETEEAGEKYKSSTLDLDPADE